MEWVTRNHALDLVAQLGHHGLIEVAIAPLVKWVRRSWIDGGPSSQRFGIPDDEKCEAQKWNGRSIQESCDQNDAESDRQKESELQNEADDLSLESLLLIFHGGTH